MNTQIKKIIEDINSKFVIIDLIPYSFDTLQAPMGIDKDLLDEVIYDCESGSTNEMKEVDIISYLNDTNETLADYIKLHKCEAERLVFLEYTNPESVQSIMDVIGTQGVLNSPEGLNIFRKHELKLQKKQWLVKNNDYLFVIEASDKTNYDSFKKTVETLPF